MLSQVYTVKVNIYCKLLHLAVKTSVKCQSGAMVAIAAHVKKWVADLTRMSNTEMMTYFEMHKGENICGRAKGTQLGKQNGFESFLFSLRKYITEKVNVTPIRMALLAMLSGLLAFTTSCMGKMAPKSPPYQNDHSVSDMVKNGPAKK